MYSEVVFGWPSTPISPSRGMSSPTEIMLVAIAVSTRSLALAGRFSRRRASATFAVGTREVSSIGIWRFGRLAKRPGSSPIRRRRLP